ncbi:MAG TPA: dihydropteroate synthase, partial [Flavobacteriales bacterium]|nr:dihydropteroate synthase [Flavobacteriales bacterium]
TAANPAVMGIVNRTPDSFYASARFDDLDAAVAAVDAMVADGVDIVDVGGVRAGQQGAWVDADAEIARVRPLLERLRDAHPDLLLSLDTWRSEVARAAVHAGAGLVNDIGAGLLDADMLPTVAALHVPYIAMHMQGTPATMQESAAYADVAGEVTHFLSGRLRACKDAGIPDVVIDPGFGFGKTTAHNYRLLHELPRIAALGAPVLVGLSRKRMVNEVLGIPASEALNGTTVLNTLALLGGAAILRVHDVREGMEVVKLLGRFQDESR